MTTTCFDPTRDELTALLAGEPRYRVDQLWAGLYEQFVPVEELSTLPKALRQRLGAELPEALELVTESASDGGETVKFLWRLADGALVETVLMHYEDRSTVCVSTQAGCAMANCEWQEIIGGPNLPQEQWAPALKILNSKELYTFRDGEVQVPQGPGLGLDFNEEAIEHYRV